MSRSSIALANLRAVVILIVLAFHSALAYLAWLPPNAYPFDRPPYEWQAIPIIDSQRWFVLDLFCAWQDLSLMSLMFFLSGLFVPASLRRKGSWTFLSDRFLRIGLPCALAVAFLMPLAYYPSYRVTALEPGPAAFWQHWLALPFWPAGPQWFLWQLLGLNILAAAIYRYAPQMRTGLERIGEFSRSRPFAFVLVFAAASAAVYVPLALVYTPWDWAHYGPLSFQYSRPLHYLVYFFAGFAVGSQGLDAGLLAGDGPLARNWAAWLAASLFGFVLWAGPTSLTLNVEGGGPVLVQIAAGVGFVVACATGCFVLLAVCLRFATRRTRMLDSLSLNAYGIYLVHYVFVVWLQYVLLEAPLFAAAKAAIVFAGTLAMSWAASAAIGGVSFGTSLVSARR